MTFLTPHNITPTCVSKKWREKKTVMNILDSVSSGLLIYSFLPHQHNWFHLRFPGYLSAIKSLWKEEWIKCNQCRCEKQGLQELMLKIYIFKFPNIPKYHTLKQMKKFVMGKQKCAEDNE